MINDLSAVNYMTKDIFTRRYYGMIHGVFSKNANYIKLNDTLLSITVQSRCFNIIAPQPQYKLPYPT